MVKYHTVIAYAGFFIVLTPHILATEGNGNPLTQTTGEATTVNSQQDERQSSRVTPWPFSRGEIHDILTTHEYEASQTSIGEHVFEELRSFSQCPQEEKETHQTNLRQLFSSLQLLEKHLNSAYVVNAPSFAGFLTSRKHLFEASEKVRYLLREISGKL